MYGYSAKDLVPPGKQCEALAGSFIQSGTLFHSKHRLFSAFYKVLGSGTKGMDKNVQINANSCRFGRKMVRNW